MDSTELAWPLTASLAPWGLTESRYRSVESIARFIAALKQSGSFEDVQLVRYYQDDQFNRMTFKFNLDVLYKLPTPPTPAPAAQPAGAPGAPVRRAGL